MPSISDNYTLSLHDALPILGDQIVIFFAKGQIGGKEPFFATAVVAGAFVFIAKHWALSQQAGNGIRQLNFTTDPGRCFTQMFKNFGLEYITADHSQVAGCIGWLGPFHDSFQAGAAVIDAGASTNPALVRILGVY